MVVIADFEHYPDWVDSMKSAEVLTVAGGKAKTVRMVLDHTLVKDDYVLAYDWKPRAVSWKLIEGNLLKAMDGCYSLKPNGAGTTVTYTLTVDINMPMIGWLLNNTTSGGAVTTVSPIRTTAFDMPAPRFSATSAPTQAATRLPVKSP